MEQSKQHRCGPPAYSCKVFVIQEIFFHPQFKVNFQAKSPGFDMCRSRGGSCVGDVCHASPV